MSLGTRSAWFRSTYCALCFIPAFLLTIATAQQLPLQTSLLANFSANLPILLSGISGAYPRDAYCSPYIIWSATGFPVALGNAGDNALPVVAAVNLPSASKVVAFGHEAIPRGCCDRNDGWDKLIINSVRWMAGTKQAITIASPSGSSWWSSSGMAGVKKAFNGIISVTTKTVEIDALASGDWKAVDIYWIDTYIQYSDAQVAALLKFANQTGKGLLVGGIAWYWGSTHPNANIFTDLPINKVLWPLGLAITTDYQVGFQPAPSRPPGTWLYYNTYLVASTLAAVNLGRTTFTNRTLYPTSNIALNSLVNSLPPLASAPASGLTQLWSLLSSARPNASSGMVIGSRNPLDPKNGYPGNILDVAIDIWAIRRGELTNMKASISGFAYPGPVSSYATRRSYDITIDGTYNLPSYRFDYANWNSPVWRSTGLYAAPGQIINVILKTPSAIGKMLQVQIGAHTDDLTFKTRWTRVPYIVSRFELKAINTSAGNPLGGLVFILVPPGSSLGDVKVTITNVVRAPYFQLNQTPRADWQTIRDYPAPWAELDSGKFVLMLPSSAIRSLSDPTPLLQHWNIVLDHMAYLANMPTKRARAERFLVDVDISTGWMHSGYPIMAYDDPGVIQEVTNVTSLQTKGAWGPYHELGHNHQWVDMQFSGTVESFNNLWTVYAMEKTGTLQTSGFWSLVSPQGRASLRASYFANGTNWERDWNVWVALDTYLQLKDGFGWDFYRNIYAVYQQMPLPLAVCSHVYHHIACCSGTRMIISKHGSRYQAKWLELILFLFTRSGVSR
ncbi:hypothetical protein Vretimale_13093 [Volvox reticuliferus]|uniref:Peptidase M60 domain-containing protein n=1 Tax=Volvox reticuliferus TaxID=1737510 RepID=A0A8J4CY25_9CHLO|nr:hypothetical protein Vretifemale_15803 [Volvox reticuliferus]GIM09192.1 hypothetical protein Vretimale_13093 [Volvox reticuliferus]